MSSQLNAQLIAARQQEIAFCTQRAHHYDALARAETPHRGARRVALRLRPLAVFAAVRRPAPGSGAGAPA